MGVSISRLIKLKSNSKGLGRHTRKLGAQAEMPLDRMGVLGQSLSDSSVHCEQNICQSFSSAEEKRNYKCMPRAKTYKIPRRLCALREFVTVHIPSGWGRGRPACLPGSQGMPVLPVCGAHCGADGLCRCSRACPGGLRSWVSELKAEWPLEVSEPV